jgi:hypothetical protein
MIRSDRYFASPNRSDAAVYACPRTPSQVRLNIEHTSGLTWLAAQQDIGAKIVCDNLNALAAFLATDEHIPVESKHRINRTLAFNTLRRLLPRALALRIVGYNTFAEALAEIAKKSPSLRQQSPTPSTVSTQTSHITRLQTRRLSMHRS